MDTVEYRYEAKEAFVDGFIQPFMPFLNQDDVTEIVVNHPKEIGILLHDGSWRWFEDHDLSEERLLQMSGVMARSVDVQMNRDRAPHAAIKLPMIDTHTGRKIVHRVQIVSGERLVSSGFALAIRKADERVRPMDHYLYGDDFDELEPYYEQTREAVNNNIQVDLNNISVGPEAAYHAAAAFQAGKNIIIAAETGAGKTSFAKTMMRWLHPEERLVTIEDTPELNLENDFRNVVHLIYNPETAKATGINADSLFKICLRLNPDRIMLGEVRSDSASAYINALNSGHAGSLVTVHANPAQAIDRMVQYAVTAPGSKWTDQTARMSLYQNIYGIFYLRKKHGSNERRNHFQCLSKTPIDWKSANPYVREEEMTKWAS